MCQESAADRAQSIFSTLDFDGWFKKKLKNKVIQNEKESSALQIFMVGPKIT